MANPAALHLAQPLDIDDARIAARRMADLRRTSEDELEKLTKTAADREADYRKAFARAFIAAEGTAAEREAIAKSEVTKESIDRDVAAGMVKVQAERLRGLEGERSMLKSLIDWSARMRLDERQVA